MVTESDIMNLALSRLGQDLILDVDISTLNNAKIVRSHYPLARDHCLRLGDWSFATKRVVLSPSVSPPEFGYDYKYELPSDYLGEQFVYDLSDNEICYEIEGRTLLCNESGIRLVYTFRNTNTSEFTPEFTSLLKLHLAKEIAYPITLSEPIARSISNELEDMKVEYLSMDSKGSGYDHQHGEPGWGVGWQL
jgi:hypothetical protein